MINSIELFYVLNGTQISLMNQKNRLYLNLESSTDPTNKNNSSKCSFKVSGIHPYLLNNDFEQEIKIISKFYIVLCSMPDYKSSKERSVIKYGDQVAFMLPNNLFIVATNDGDLKIQRLEGDQTLSSVNLPINSKFTILPPENNFPSNKPILFDDIIILRSAFGGFLGLTTTNNSILQYQKDGQIKIGKIDDINTGINSNSNVKIDECKWQIVKVDVPYIPSWNKKRKFLNHNIDSYFYHLQKSFFPSKNPINNDDFNISNSKRISNKIDESKLKLSNFSSNDQDKLLVNDLIQVMIGYEGNYIKRVINNPSYKDFKVEFEIEPYLDNPTCEPPLLSLTNLILPMGYYYSSICYFKNVSLNPETGLVVKSFCEGLDKILREYLLFVNQLEESKNNTKNPMNLQQLWWVVQPSMKLLECLHKLCKKCFMIKGGALLNIIYSAYLHENDTQIKSMYKFLLKKSFSSFFDMLKLWVCHGILENEHDYQEFMIFSPKSYIKEKLKDYFHDLFWENKYTLSQINIPQFLSNIANKILFIGKSYDIIKECGKNVKCPYENEFESFRDMCNDENNDDINNIINNNFNIYKSNNNIVNFNGLNNNNNNSLVNTNQNPSTLNQMIFETERTIEFEKLIDKIYKWINDTLKNVLFNEKDLISMIHSFKKYFLMEKGDFYNDFIELNFDLFNLSLSSLNSTNNYKKSENPIQMPIINDDENKEKFKFIISNMTVENLKSYFNNYNKILGRNNENDIMKIADELEKIDRANNKIRITKPEENVKIIEVIDIDPTINWPLNLVFSKKNIIKYKLLFRQLIHLKYVEKLLCNVFILQQDLKELNIQTKFKESFYLRDCMLNFVKNIIYYLFNEVIEPNYLQLLKNLENAKSMEEIINFHDKFLVTCLNDGLIGDEIKKKLNDIVNCCNFYCYLIIQYISKIRLQAQEELQEIIVHRNSNYGNEFFRKKEKNKEKNLALQKSFFKHEKSYRTLLGKLTNSFNVRLKAFLDTVKQINDNQKTNLANLLTKIDYNNFYHDKFSQQEQQRLMQVK